MPDWLVNGLGGFLQTPEAFFHPGLLFIFVGFAVIVVVIQALASPVLWVGGAIVLVIARYPLYVLAAVVLLVVLGLWQNRKG